MELHIINILSHPGELLCRISNEPCLEAIKSAAREGYKDTITAKYNYGKGVEPLIDKGDFGAFRGGGKGKS